MMITAHIEAVYIEEVPLDFRIQILQQGPSLFLMIY